MGLGRDFVRAKAGCAARPEKGVGWFFGVFARLDLARRHIFNDVRSVCSLNYVSCWLRLFLIFWFTHLQLSMRG